MATSVDAIRTFNAKNSPLLSKLPGEMRNKLYRVALLEPFVEVDFKTIYNKTALLRTCGQIKEEASAVFYRESQFVITDAAAQKGDVTKLLTCMGAESRKRVSSIILTNHLPEAAREAFKMLEANHNAGMTLQESAKVATKELGLPEETSFKDVLSSIYSDAMAPVKIMATILIRSNVPVMALAGRYVFNGALRDPERRKDVVATSEHHIVAGMAEAFMEVAVAEHNRSRGVVAVTDQVSGGVDGDNEA
jgi:hypothetical protein